MSADTAARPAADPHPRVVPLTGALAPELVDSWRALATRLPGTSFFQTPEWVMAWWDSLAHRPPTELACWYGARGELRALVALSRVTERLDRRFPVSVPILANSGSGPGDADHCGPLATEELRTQVAAWLSRVSERRALLIRSVDADSDVPVPEGMRRVATTPCPRLQVERPAGRAVRSSNFRRQLARSLRQLEREGVSFEWMPPGGFNREIVTAVHDLHIQRRDSTGASTNVQLSQSALLTALSATAAPGRGPAGVVARLGARIIGVVVGFRWKETFSAYQSGWDPAFAAQSLGSALVDRCIELSALDGVETFDFLRGDEPYKYRFGAIDKYDHSYLLARGIAGRTLDLTRRLRDLRSSARTGRRAASPR